MTLKIAARYTRAMRRSRRLVVRFQRGIHASSATGNITRMARRRSKRKPIPRVSSTAGSALNALASKPEKPKKNTTRSSANSTNAMAIAPSQ
ncbi:hypothetical protein D3C86_2080040 [compost metagenome]